MKDYADVTQYHYFIINGYESKFNIIKGVEYQISN